jgi:hypothetical protein
MCRGLCNFLFYVMNLWVYSHNHLFYF